MSAPEFKVESVGISEELAMVLTSQARISMEILSAGPRAIGEAVPNTELRAKASNFLEFYRGDKSILSVCESKPANA